MKRRWRAETAHAGSSAAAMVLVTPWRKRSVLGAGRVKKSRSGWWPSLKWQSGPRLGNKEGLEKCSHSTVVSSLGVLLDSRNDIWSQGHRFLTARSAVNAERRAEFYDVLRLESDGAKESRIDSGKTRLQRGKRVWGVILWSCVEGWPYLGHCTWNWYGTGHCPRALAMRACAARRLAVGSTERAGTARWGRLA